jgi:hypothetical protein
MGQESPQDREKDNEVRPEEEETEKLRWKKAR